MDTHLFQTKAILRRAEAKLQRQMARRLVRQDFFGGLHVQPQWLYVDQTTGRAAMARLRHWPHGGHARG